MSDSPTNNQILIGHLDTGLDPQHPMLRDSIHSLWAIDRQGKAIVPEAPLPAISHGTHTAGIICGGIVSDIPILSTDVQICSVAVSTTGKGILKLLAGMDTLLSFDIRVACMAIGIRKQTPIFVPFLEAFRQKGILAILPIGNGGDGMAHVPASYPGVLSVGAIDTQGRMAKFSGSFGSATSLKPELLAPGVDILSAAPNGKAQRKSGTSMACAWVTAMAARILQARPASTAAEIRHALISTAKPPLAGDRCRHGIVALEAAFDAIQTMNVAPALPVTFPLEAQEQYIDERFLASFQRSVEGAKLEAILVPQSIDKQAQDSFAKASRMMIEEVAVESGQAPTYVRFFEQVDAVHVQASQAFFACILKRPDLLICSAVDMSIFES